LLGFFHDKAGERERERERESFMNFP